MRILKKNVPNVLVQLPSVVIFHEYS
jgi:hypothetical protein